MQTQVTEWSSALMTSLAAAMALFFSAIPKIFGFVIILIIGWLVASLIEKGIAAILRTIRFNDLAQRSGLADFVAKTGTGTDSAGMLAAIVKWFIRLIALVVAFDALGLPAVSDVLRQLLLWLPNVVVALVVLVIGGLAASALSNVVRGAAAKSSLGNPDMLAKVAAGLVWAFSIVVAVNQIGIATALVNTLFMAVVGAIALALGLSFGLGGKDTAAEIVRNWYQKGQQNKDKVANAVNAAAGQGQAVGAGGTARPPLSTGSTYASGSSPTDVSPPRTDLR
ncbi:MAG: hypothetical protein JWP47_2007 [Polaromonas sp.]|jgi:hypothetical protein|nr:hypothetical protein [Polaromonas sp.]